MITMPLFYLWGLDSSASSVAQCLDDTAFKVAAFEPSPRSRCRGARAHLSGSAFVIARETLCKYSMRDSDSAVVSTAPTIIPRETELATIDTVDPN